MQVHMGIFCHLSIKFLPISFLSILERKHFGVLGEKTPEPHQFFSLLSLQPNTHQKSFHFHLLSKVFHPSTLFHFQTNTSLVTHCPAPSFFKLSISSLLNFESTSSPSLSLSPLKISRISVFGSKLKSQFILLFSLFLLLFISSIAFFGTIYRSRYTISANFYLYLQYFKQKVFNFSKIIRS